MEVTGEQIIAARVLRELKTAKKVLLGPGMPEALVPYLANDVRWFRPGRNGSSGGEVDVAVVEALEVSEGGDLSIHGSFEVAHWKAERWIVASPIVRPDGGPLMVKHCQFPVQKDGCVDLVITDLGVVAVDKVGFELRELAPGTSSDHVRLNVKASLHVADDIKTIEL